MKKEISIEHVSAVAINEIICWVESGSLEAKKKISLSPVCINRCDIQDIHKRTVTGIDEWTRGLGRKQKREYSIFFTLGAPTTVLSGKLFDKRIDSFEIVLMGVGVNESFNVRIFSSIRKLDFEVVSSVEITRR